MTGPFVYPLRALAADYARAAAGLPLVAVVVFLPMHPLLTALVAALAAMFASFGLRTAFRQASPVVLTETGIHLTGPFGRAINWAELEGVRLRYYSMRRDRTRGWLELILEGSGRTIRIESQIIGFETIVSRAAIAAAARGLALDEATTVNLAALDFGV